MSFGSRGQSEFFEAGSGILCGGAGSGHAGTVRGRSGGGAWSGGSGSHLWVYAGGSPLFIKSGLPPPRSQSEAKLFVTSVATTMKKKEQK